MYEMIRNLLKHFKNPKTDTWEEPPAPLPEDEEEVGAYTCEEPSPSAPPPQTRDEMDPRVQKEEAYTCMDCMEQRNENCFGKKKICPDFRYAPRITQQDRETWPKFGDATGFRLKAVKRRKK